jgi:hypothetical protein
MTKTNDTISVGTYGSSFFGYSVTHTIAESRRVLSALNGNYVKNKAVWKNTSAQDKRLFLLEQHESAHHHLLASTPCGLLLWRLNQVISRDISWAKRKIAPYGVTPQPYAIPRNFYQKPEFFEKLVDNGCSKDIADFICHVYGNVENSLIVRDIFFGAKSPCNKDYPSLTLGELSDRLNKAFEWMSQCCAIPWSRQWKVKGNRDALVFSNDCPINAHDIAEAHAVAHELSAIRSFGDKIGFNHRYNTVFGTAYEAGLEVGRRDLPKAEDVEFSPSILRHRGLLAFCTCIDLTVAQGSREDLFIEDHLPWLQFERYEIFAGESLQKAMETLNDLVTNSVYSPDSKWAVLKNMNHDTGIEGFASNMHWLGLDLQVHAFHRNAKTNLSYLLSYVKKEDFAYDQVSNQAIDNNYLIEYSDQLLTMTVDLKNIYGKNWVQLIDLGFEKINNFGMQILCHLLNGATSRNTIAHFLRQQIPSPEIIAPKIATAIRELYSVEGVEKNRIEQDVTSVTSLITQLIENGEFGEKGEASYLVNNNGRFIL